MSYSKVFNGISQADAIENLKALISSDYFKKYDFLKEGSNISSSIMHVNKISPYSEFEKSYSVGDIGATVNVILDTIKDKGILYKALIQLCPSEERLMSMDFEKGVYDGELQLPLSLFVAPADNSKDKEYFMRIFQLGIKRSYLEDNNLDIKDANKKLGLWYAELTRNLNKILPKPAKV